MAGASRQEFSGFLPRGCYELKINPWDPEGFGISVGVQVLNL